MQIKSSALALLLVAGVGACSDDDNNISSASLGVSNRSDFALTELFLTSVGNPDFGPNLLDGDALLPGEDIVLGVPCDTYDALVIDDAGVQCTLNAVDLCFSDSVWVITNNTCSIFSAREDSTPQKTAERVAPAAKH